MIFRPLVFDIETDGLYDDCSKIFSLVIYDLSKDVILSCTDYDSSYPSIKQGLDKLRSPNSIFIGHNILMFDIPVIRKILGDRKSAFLFDKEKHQFFDTLLMSRLLYPNIKDIDFRMMNKGVNLGKLVGSHSLEAWGIRLGNLKGDYNKREGAWQEWSKDMQDYCEQDVKVTVELYEKELQMIRAWKGNKKDLECFSLEHEFARIIEKQEKFGFMFDEEKAFELFQALNKKRDSLETKLKKTLPPTIKKASGKEVPFNPSSRQHIIDVLISKYDWKPEEYTEKGNPKMDETILDKLDYPECKVLGELFMVNKRLGQLAEGSQAWIKLSKHGVIHGGVITNGAVTGRCTHINPNISQVPAPYSPYGKECRSLFGPPKGYIQLGFDASGLELRCLSHYMVPYDGGDYMHTVLNGDIHTVNQKAAGLATRDEAKTFIYAFLYGAGDLLIGELVSKDKKLFIEAKRAIGKQVKQKFLGEVPALKMLVDKVTETARDRGYLIGLDGRRLYVRSLHSALNLLLQSAGAILMKKATCLFWKYAESELGMRFGIEIAQMAHIHDEFQLAVREGEDIQRIGELAIRALSDAGKFFNFKCPLTGEYKQGANWAETH